MFVLCLLTLTLIIQVLGDYCDDILCSNLNDYVCTRAETSDGKEIIREYQNICYVRKKQCEIRNDLQSIEDDLILKQIDEIPYAFCDSEGEMEVNFEENMGGRRVRDYSIVGAHQFCNHTCPLYCTDHYEPACAQIWYGEFQSSSSFKPMINHCHIDLFSCASGKNVTIQPLSKCYENPVGLLFMMHVAAMKSLRLLADTPSEEVGRQTMTKHLPKH